MLVCCVVLVVAGYSGHPGLQPGGEQCRPVPRSWRTSQLCSSCHHRVTPHSCCRSDRESSASRMARMAGQTTTSLQDERLEMLNQTVTGAEPSSPCREAARGESPLMFTALLDSNQDTVGGRTMGNIRSSGGNFFRSLLGIITFIIEIIDKHVTS